MAHPGQQPPAWESGNVSPGAANLFAQRSNSQLGLSASGDECSQNCALSNELMGLVRSCSTLGFRALLF